MEAELAKFRAEKQKIEKQTGLSSRLSSYFSWRGTSRKEIEQSTNRALDRVYPSESGRQEDPGFVHTSGSLSAAVPLRSGYDNFLRWTSIVLKFFLWSILMFLFVKLEFGAVFFVFSLFYFICTNLRTSPKAEGELSAYSVFNPNFERLDGTLTAEQFESEIRFGAASIGEVTVNVLFFAKARELVSCHESRSKLRCRNTGDGLKRQILELYPELAQIGRNVIISLNQVYVQADDDVLLNDGDEVAVIPPISGG